MLPPFLSDGMAFVQFGLFWCNTKKYATVSCTILTRLLS